MSNPENECGCGSVVKQSVLEERRKKMCTKDIHIYMFCEFLFQAPDGQQVKYKSLVTTFMTLSKSCTFTFINTGKNFFFINNHMDTWRILF